MKKFLSEPYLLSLKPDTEMYILWVLSEKTAGCIEYGNDENLGNKLNAQCYEIKGLYLPRDGKEYADKPEENIPVTVYQYIAKIEKLTPGQKIYYKCFAGEESTKTYFFHTAPQKGEDYTFAQISDLQSLPNCNETLYQIGSFHPDFLLFSGDATYVSWRLFQWFDTGEENQSDEDRKKAFFSCMQQENGARLMQYAPLFFAPGNHEPNDMQCTNGLRLEECDEKWNWSLFMELFRPLYPGLNTGTGGVRWYSVDYSDMHIVSLSINRLGHITPSGKYVYFLHDSISPDSPQIKWLEKDLENTNAKYKWVIQHFHILNRAWDAQFNLCDPVVDEDENISYPTDGGAMLIDIFSKYGVNAVSYGHSHVYERYFTKGTHYIESAYLAITFARENSPLHPSGLAPVFEDNSRRSFMIAKRCSEGIFATGYYADNPPIPFDSYQIADKDGNSVSPY